MTDNATYLAHLAIVAAFTLVALLAIAMLAYELIRDILPYTKGEIPVSRTLPPFHDQVPPPHPAWGWLGAAFAVVTLGGAMIVEAML